MLSFLNRIFFRSFFSTPKSDKGPDAWTLAMPLDKAYKAKLGGVAAVGAGRGSAAGGGGRHRHSGAPSAAMQKHGKKAKRWKMITLILLPLVLIGAHVFCYKPNHERPPYVPYEYMYVRTKKFPWGDGNKTFFHNPCMNALPGIGYEDDPSCHGEMEGEEGEEGAEGEEGQSGEGGDGDKDDGGDTDAALEVKGDDANEKDESGDGENQQDEVKEGEESEGKEEKKSFWFFGRKSSKSDDNNQQADTNGEDGEEETKESAEDEKAEGNEESEEGTKKSCWFFCPKEDQEGAEADREASQETNANEQDKEQEKDQTEETESDKDNKEGGKSFWFFGGSKDKQEDAETGDEAKQEADSDGKDKQQESEGNETEVGEEGKEGGKSCWFWCPKDGDDTQDTSATEDNQQGEAEVDIAVEAKVEGDESSDEESDEEESKGSRVPPKVLITDKQG